MADNWKQIPGFESLYEASCDGQVRGIARYCHKKPLAGHRDKDGLIRISLRRDGKTTIGLLHRLLLETFVGPCPPNYEGTHVDGNRANNKILNLEWRPRATSNAVLFWSHVFKPTDEQIAFSGLSCWVWLGSGNDYGKFSQKVDGLRVTRPAHRFAYELTNGPIADDLPLDHLCRNTFCVNPDHQEPVTQRENIRRGFGIAGNNARKTHCVRGHPFDQENTNLSMRAGVIVRRCRACRRKPQGVMVNG